MSILRKVFHSDPSSETIHVNANEKRPSVTVTDYSAARAKAIAWLGDRYLLARPINAKTSHRQAIAG